MACMIRAAVGDRPVNARVHVGADRTQFESSPLLFVYAARPFLAPSVRGHRPPTSAWIRPADRPVRLTDQTKDDSHSSWAVAIVGGRRPRLCLLPLGRDLLSRGRSLAARRFYCFVPPLPWRCSLLE
jgi:hypothetical protein